ncbi:MAG: prepilin peptidase, partial [Mobilicoccus sp.]|nr:prepilin peptidase [Mobilicoccus sp.]
MSLDVQAWPLFSGAWVAPALAAATAATVGVAAQRAHARGWYARDGDPAPRRHPIALLLLVAWTLLALRPWTPLTLLDLALVAVLLVAAAVDVEVRRLPDVLTLTSAGVAASAAAATWVLTGSTDAARALAAGLLVPAVALVITLTIGGLGLGDVKILAPIATVLAWHGTTPLLHGFLITWAGAGLFAFVVLGLRRPRSTTIPLGPHLALGTTL